MANDLLPAGLVGELTALIEGTRARVAATVNQELVLRLYWPVGQRIHVDRMVKFTRPFPDR